MPGTYQYDVEIKSNVAKLLSDMKQVQDRLDTVEGKEYKIKLNIDEKKLSSVIFNLEKMLDSLGKGTGDFKQLENLSKELSAITSEVKDFSKAFGKLDDSGAKTLLSSIQSIDRSLSDLSQHILNVNKNMSNMGGNTSGAVKQVENISNAYQDAAKEAEKLADAQSKIGQKTNISSVSAHAIEQQIKQQDKLQDEIRETIALTNEYGEVIDVYRGTHGLIGNGNVSNRYHGGTFWTSNRKLATQSYADGNKVTHANLYMQNPYLVHGGGADWDQLTLSIKQGEELEKHLENVYVSINDVFSKIQDTSGIEAGHLFDVFDGQLNFTDFENGIQKPIESLKDFQNIFESINYDNSKIPQVQNYINQLYDLFTSYSRISQLSEKGVLNTNEVVEIAKALKYDGVVFNGIRDGSDDSSDIFVTFEEKQSKVIDMITAAQLRAEEEQQLANILVNTRENLYKTLKSLDTKQVDEFIDKSAFNFVTDGSYMENLGEVLGKADPTDSIDNIKNKIREYINEVVNEFENAQKQIAASTDQMKDAFPDKDVSASVESATNSIKEENNVLEQNTQKVKENTQAKEQNVNVNFNKYDKRLDSYNGKINKYKTTINRFNDGGWTSNTYLENVKAVENAVKEYEDLLKELKGKDASLVTSEDINKLDNYEKKIKDTIATVTNMPASEKGYNFVSGQKELDKIHKLLAENSKMSSEAKAKIRAYYAEIESGNPSMSLDKIHGEIMKIYNAEVEAGRAGRSFFDTLKNSGFHQIAAQMAGMVGVYDVINLGKEAVSTIVKLDTALVDLKKTTSMSSSQLENFYYDSNNVAKQMGVTTEEIINQASAWSRLGYSSQEAATTMAKLSSQFASISPGMDTDTAQQGLVSIMKAWDIDYTDVKSEIMDNINALGNGMAEDNQDIVEGMERSAAALAAVGTSYEDAFAMFSGIQEVLQNAEKSGTALRSLAMRVRGYDESTEELSDDLKNVTGDLINLTKTAEHTQGVSIFKDGSTTEFKDLTTYFGEIASIWDEMTQKQQNDYLQKAFGKNQAQAGAALIQNYKGVTKALDIMTDAAGSSDREMETIESSLEYKINALKETWVGTVQDIIDRGDVGTIVDGLTKVSEAIGFITGKLGLLGSTGTVLSGVLGAKGLGLT